VIDQDPALKESAYAELSPLCAPQQQSFDLLTDELLPKLV